MSQEASSLLNGIIQYSEKTDTDISSHLPKIFTTSLNHLQKHNGRVIVQLGLHRGDALYVFNEVSKVQPVTIIGIEKSSQPAYEHQLRPGNRIYNMDDIEYSKIHLTECVKNRIKHTIDILFIDCSHLYLHTVKELEHYVPLLDPHGMIILHDTYMSPIQPGFGWQLKNGNVLSGGWDNQRGVSHALENYFGIKMTEWQDFTESFVHNEILWSLEHEYICNGLTILRKIERKPTLEKSLKLVNKSPDRPTIPIYIIAFNNLTYVKNTIRQLKQVTENLIIIDNNSTYPPLLNYYTNECKYKVIRNNENLFVESSLIKKFNHMFPDYFALTDPDLAYPSNIDINTLYILKDLTEKYNVYKAGLALCIDKDQDFRDIKAMNGRSIREWEQQFWVRRLNDDKYEVYKANVATTFAVYNKKNFRGSYLDGVRLAGPYQCLHLPWYKSCTVPTDELEYYAKSQKYSTWLVNPQVSSDVKIMPSQSTNNIVFIDEKNITSPGGWWYRHINQLYKNILMRNGYNVITLTLSCQNNQQIDPQMLDNLLASKSYNDFYFFNPVNFSIFMTNVRRPELRGKIYDFLSGLKYIVLWQEIMNEHLSIIGYHVSYIDQDFILSFFGNSRLNLMSNMSSINALKKYGINHNRYHPVVGHSPINQLVAFDPSQLNTTGTSAVDVLVYGTRAPSYTYRENFIKKLLDSNKYGLSIEVLDNVYGNDLDNYLKRAKIVVHIPSHPNLQHMPWSKIAYLQSRKVFYIIEDNDELYEKALEGAIVSYKKNDIADLYRKINYYLTDEAERNRLIEANHDWISKFYNLDVDVPRLVKDFWDPPKNDRLYVFLNIKYDIQWSSIQFYFTMMEKIKNVLSINGCEYRLIDKISDIKKYGANTQLIIDISVIINLFYNRQSELEELMKIPYILIIGENVDEKQNTFMGWDQCAPLNQLNFSPGNLLMRIMTHSRKITYQNDKLLKLLLTIKNKNDIYFFPIDGYRDEYVIKNTRSKKDIDVLFYGAMCYQRRLDVIEKLSTMTPINYVICNNIFDNDDLIDRSKIILHVNSIDNCYHIPFAKLVKLLSNNKIVVVESTEELTNSDLINYVTTFNYKDRVPCLGKQIPTYLSKINHILGHYDEEQKKLNEKNPQKLIKEKYNFNVYVKKLLEV